MAKQALGIIETKGLCTLMEATDAALKAADISFTGWEKIGSGWCAAFFCGDVAAVKAGIEAASQAATAVGEVVSVNVIPRPHDDLVKLGKFISA